MLDLKRYTIIVLPIFYACYAFGQQPAMPEVTSLSIDPVGGQVQLKWRSPEVADNVLVHEISRREYASPNYFFSLHATIPVPDTVYSETVSDLETQRYGYRIRSKNSLTASPLSDMYVTMTFSGEYSQCSNTFNLRWTEYRRFAIDENGQIDTQNAAANTFNSAIEYEVWGHHGAVFDLAQAEKMSARGAKNINIEIENLTTNTTYFLFVKAFLPTGDTATSYHIEIPTINKTLPSVMNIDSVIGASGMIDLYLNVDKHTGIDTFAIYRVGTRIPLVWYYSVADIPSKFTDRTGSIGQVYRYNIVGFLCGKPFIQSDTVSNILMYATPSGLNAEIIWTEFVNESETPVYSLHRLSPPAPAIDPGNSLRFVDVSTGDLVCNGPQKFCYVLTARTSKSFARSEQACVSLSSAITMPEAIDPLSTISSAKNCNCQIDCENHRRLFGPVMDINDLAYSMEMEIYDRSGDRIFRSKKTFDEALQKEYHYWNGRDKNSPVKPGIYVYYVKVEFLESPPVTMRGSVTVVMHNQK
ncbi:MAG: gliding motility-associated C-terminal domain-containing protein [Prevotellaceae bacterium]|jgi:hypothetical protein|nr:gliding motility-associated C-terminal domain-containing protein [Prevotellaceae bacterium]